jgi:hypothetical protein
MRPLLAWGVGVASEGSFGPHPYIPFLPPGRELVLLIDRKAAIELIGFDADSDTNFGHAVARHGFKYCALDYHF